ncbi:hypothetical protein LOTGIDRAFT_233081 [Lottia gigantea]|uniref:Cytochrome P450 10 n=1 Tax=Lottia gigantea TaxID=225164 RepID=V4AGV6_LOTGI|nr:hypothetical protein LOTGIDRAFT_233081 [Lottia gigantea]ESO92641.1 hypothetical protein LOTGIDRAFT_233081 [Lottia gigantea]
MSSLIPKTFAKIAVTALPEIATKRVVSTSVAHKQSARVIEVDPLTLGTCPFRSTFEKVESIVNPIEPKVEPQELTKETGIKSFEHVPGPKGLPILGSLLDYFKKDGLRFDKMFEAFKVRSIEFGPVYKESIGPIDTVVISDPAEYAKVIRADGKFPNRKEMEPMAFYREQKGIGLGLVNSQGEEWHRQRSAVIKKMLMLNEVQDFSQPMNVVANDFITHLSSSRDASGEIQQLDKQIFKWAMESIGTFLFEERIGCLNEKPTELAQEFIDTLQKYFRLMQQLMYNLPMYKVFRTKKWQEFEKLSDRIMEVGREFVDKKIEKLQNADPSTSQEKGAFLTHLISQKSLSTSDVTSNAVDLLSAAVETTSNASLWCLYNLATNPEAQQTMFNEINTVLPNKEDVTPQALSKLPYVKAVLKETFRKYPITYATSRFLPENLEVGGYNIPAGTHVQANLYGMYSDAKIFPEPEKFKPERWLRESKMDSQTKSLSNLIWGHGARMCIGRRFAEQEMHIMLTKIIQNFKLEYHHEPVEPTLNTVMTPDRPVQIKFVPRS